MPSADWPISSDELTVALLAAWSMPQPEGLDGMDENTPEGATKSAVFLPVRPYIMATGDTTTWDELFLPADDCNFAESFSTQATTFHSDESWIDNWTPKCSIETSESVSKTITRVVIDSSLESIVIHQNQGVALVHRGASNKKLTFTIEWQNDAWRITECANTPS